MKKSIVYALIFTLIFTTIPANSIFAIEEGIGEGHAEVDKNDKEDSEDLESQIDNSTIEDKTNTSTVEDSPDKENEVHGGQEEIHTTNTDLSTEGNLDSDSKEVEDSTEIPETVTLFSANTTSEVLTGDDVVKLKQDLTKIGFGNFPSNPSSVYGSVTERVVREFQEYYGLTVDGKAGNETLSKITEILSSPYRDGQSGEHITRLKEKLTRLGFGNFPSNPSGAFGSVTARVVSEFQESHGLVVNGIGDEVTLNKIQQFLSPPFKNGHIGQHIVELKQDLTTLGFGNFPSNPSGVYGSVTARVVSEFQKYYSLNVTGEADEETISMLEETLSSMFRSGNSGDEIVELKNNLTLLGFGNFPSDPSGAYGSVTARVVSEFQAHYGLIVNGIGDIVTLNKIDILIDEQKPPYKSGHNGEHIVNLKNNLSTLGFGNFPSNPSGAYGSVTSRVVSEFQEYYSLEVNGTADEATLAKVDEILSSPYRTGQSGVHIVELKESLTTLGFGNFPSNPSGAYGSVTARVVSEFQAHYGLVVNGIADEVTLSKIDEMLELQYIVTFTEYAVTFNGALNTQLAMSIPPQTDAYRNLPAFIHSSLVSIDHKGVISSGVNIRTSPDSTTSSNIQTTTTSQITVNVIEEVTGNSVNGNNKWFKIEHNNRELYVHDSVINISDIAIITSNGNVYESANTSSHNFGRVTPGDELKEFVIVRELTGTRINGSNKWYQINFRTWRNAKRSDVIPFFDPNQNDIFQHLVLSSSAGVSASQLNAILSGRGTLNNTGKYFIDGGKKHSVNEVYLIAHALHETGNGSSTLARGVEVGLNSNGQPRRVTSSNRNSLTDIKTTYNMYGIGAADTCPISCGAEEAYKQGWFSIEEAIIGGAEFIGRRYIHNQYQQNTLYKMRWNPANPGYPQYATDMEWATKQISRIKNLYDQLENPVLHFDIPVYK
ncbi:MULTISPECIES: peptidoglycan-binding protein [Bacillaceae]|uniref:Peptidoglycan-binding protein n=1 Tax=Evansella alkalicola TaxID=745819 RepID=A0ABS6JPV5_9BACI|nr:MULTISPECIES: peptidoglycan-binding protein [Bacillaceae]MBU9720598.1 peptidoglycan-binding protein [Bacillus alkalicola]